MSELILLIPRVVITLGGAAAGVIAAVWKSLGSRRPDASRQSVARVSATRMATARVPARAEIAAQYVVLQNRLARIESLVERHEEKLRTLPSTQEIVAAMNEVFDRSASALDERFAEQARALEGLKLMVSQTDELLEKVLDSIYALPEQPPQEPERPSLPQ